LNEFAALIEMELRGGSIGTNEPNFREVASSVLEVIEQFSHKTNSESARLSSNDGATICQRAAPTSQQALQHLLRLMNDPTVNARDRLKAAQILKQYLLALEHLLQSRQTTPELHKAIMQVLRKYWQS